MARWNSDVIQGLYKVISSNLLVYVFTYFYVLFQLCYHTMKGINESLSACGVSAANTFTTYVPGSFELPITARFLAASKRVSRIYHEVYTVHMYV